MLASLVETGDEAVPLVAVTATGFAAWAEGLPAEQRAWLSAIGFKGEVGRTALVPGEGGRLAMAVQGVDQAEAIWAFGGLSDSLPAGLYRAELSGVWLEGAAATAVALGWALGSYHYDRFKPTAKTPRARLIWPTGADAAQVQRRAAAIGLGRDLINCPAESLGPAELAEQAIEVGGRHGATVTVTVGDDLLTAGYPMIHAVGRASVRAPRLIDLTWGDPAAPKLTLVGKGVCFDSGGLDIKSASGMKMMKKDMGGAGTVLALADLIMATGLKLRLRVLIPAVENSIDGRAFRPMDVFRTRKGTTVEIGNTDAEGRLVLCDALTEAVSEKPALLIDIATLTGAARVALGPELPALFSNQDPLANDLLACGVAELDPLWRLPLWAPYRKYLDSKVAEINNASDSGFAGSITAALYLQEFVPAATPWIHIDSYAWNSANRPGRPEGGEPLTLRALERLITQRFA